jgi:acyl-CoA synthetase (NDP forming)
MRDRPCSNSYTQNTVPQIIEDCGNKGVKAAIIISAGFKETGKEGKQLEEKIKEMAKRHNMRLIGPNCIGYINTNPSISLNASFAKGMPNPGNIALVSQSGAICLAMLEYSKARKMGFSKIFSLGNKPDVNENDLFSVLSNDKDTKVILMYIEDLANGRRFIETVSKITGGDIGDFWNKGRRRLNGKPILALKVGESTIGAKSIASHTGALAGSHETYNAIFAQSGVIRVETLEELFDYAIAFAYQPIPSFDDDGKNITIRNNIDIDTTNNKNHKIIADTTTKTVGTAIVSDAGGPAAIVADIAERYNLKLAELTGETVNELKRVLPKTASSIINPVDIIGDADHIIYEKALRAILKDPNVNSCIVISTPQMMLNIKSLVNIIIKIN